VIAIPAVDLRDGQCVQLVGGSYEQERVRLPDPVQVAEGWAREPQAARPEHLQMRVQIQTQVRWGLLAADPSR